MYTVLIVMHKKVELTPRGTCDSGQCMKAHCEPV